MSVRYEPLPVSGLIVVASSFAKALRGEIMRAIPTIGSTAEVTYNIVSNVSVAVMNRTLAPATQFAGKPNRKEHA